MLQIERLILRLPAGYQHRASTIARLVGKGLAQVKISSSQAGTHCVIPTVRIGPNVSDQTIAKAVIAGITNKLETGL